MADREILNRVWYSNNISFYSWGEIEDKHLKNIISWLSRRITYLEKNIGSPGYPEDQTLIWMYDYKQSLSGAKLERTERRKK
jgi:hypothetical protein